MNSVRRFVSENILMLSMRNHDGRQIWEEIRLESLDSGLKLCASFLSCKFRKRQDISGYFHVFKCVLSAAILEPEILYPRHSCSLKIYCFSRKASMPRSFFELHSQCINSRYSIGFSWKCWQVVGRLAGSDLEPCLMPIVRGSSVWCSKWKDPRGLGKFPPSETQMFRYLKIV